MSSQPKQPCWSSVGYLLLGVACGVTLLGRWLSGSGNVPGLFGRWDVLACTACCGVPLAMALAQAIRCGKRWETLSIAVTCWAFSALLLMLSTAGVAMEGPGGELTRVAWRLGATLLLSVGVALAVPGRAWPAFDSRGAFTAGRECPPSFGRASWLWLVALAVLVPAVYADSVADRIRDHLRQSLEGQRLSRALGQTQQLSQLKPGWLVDGTRIDRLQQQLGEAVDRLIAEAGIPLHERAPVAHLGRRITVLVQLERAHEALPLVRSLSEGEDVHPVALDFLGLCYQRLEQPAASLQAYRRAVAHWRNQPPGPARTKGLASAQRGIGFAARRLNDRSLEERAYRRLVEVAPTAESHILLAQCYREHQKTELATRHATRALELDPRMHESAASILSSLATDHFGCLQVPR